MVHAGPGAEALYGNEEGGQANNIWSCKWNLHYDFTTRSGKVVNPFLTVPEDAQVGVVCHELGHLLYGW